MAKQDTGIRYTEGDLGSESAYVRKSNTAIRELAMAILSGTAFGSWQVDDPSLLGSVFMPLMMMDDIQRKSMKRDNIVHLYGFMKDAAPRSINGMPMFFGMHVLNAEDTERLNEAMKTLREFMKGDEEEEA